MTRRMRTTATFLVIATLALSSLLAADGHVAMAQENEEQAAKFRLEPVDAENGYFDLTMSAGETRQFELDVINAGTVHGEAMVYVADVSTRVNGGVAAELAGEEVTGSGLWISWPEDTVSVEAGARATKAFTISVPADAPVGQHLTSFVIQDANDGSNSEPDRGVMLKTVSRHALPVLITIPGEVEPALDMNAASHVVAGSTSVIVVDVTNAGNVLLKTIGEVSVTDATGHEVYQTAVEYGSIYAGTSTTLEVPVGVLLEPGDYTVKMWLEDAAREFRVESNPLSLHVPTVLASDRSGSASSNTAINEASESSTQSVIESQSAGLPAWALLIAVPVAVVAGAVGVFVVMKRRMQPAAVAVAPAQPQMAVRESPAPVARQRVPVRQIVPPSRRGERA